MRNVKFSVDLADKFDDLIVEAGNQRNIISDFIGLLDQKASLYDLFLVKNDKINEGISILSNKKRYSQ